MDLSKPQNAIYDTNDRITRQQELRNEKMIKNMNEKKPRKRKVMKA